MRSDDPFEVLERTFDRMRQLLEFAVPPGTDLAAGSEATRLDLVDDDEYVITVNLAGIVGDPVDVRVTDGALVVDIDRPPDGADTAEKRRWERTGNTESRSFELPEQVDAASARATVRGDVLTLIVPVAGLTVEPRSDGDDDE